MSRHHVVTMCIITGWSGCISDECGLPPEYDVTDHPVPWGRTCEVTDAAVRV